MFTHLANTWILARLVLGFIAIAVASVALVASIGILRDYDANAPPDDRTLMLERRAELIATALQLAFGAQLIAAVLTVVVSDRLSTSIRGAMCAYGVVHSSPWGVRSLATSLAAALAAAAWIGQRRVDARLRRGSLVRTLAGGAIAVTLIMYVDAFATATYLLGLDMTVVATCCTVFVDASRGAVGLMGDAHGRLGELWRAAGVSVVALGSGVALARRATAGRGLFAAATGLGASALAIPALADVVAPFAYETPNHRCAYCLLRGEGGPAGPVVLAALGVGMLLSASTLAIVPLLRREGARSDALAVMSRLGRWSAAAWTIVIVAGAWPLLAYRFRTGTIDLFR